MSRPEPTDRVPVLEARRVGMRFGGIQALHDIDLALQPAEVHGVIGPNGAGKTTLFDILAGLRRPTTGSVLLDGEDVTRRPAVWRARHGLRRTFQRQQVFSALSVVDNLRTSIEGDRRQGGVVLDLVGLGGRWSGGEDTAERVDEVLERCGLADLRDVPAGSLTIGAARMLEMARALIARPRVLLLDEPTSGLGANETERLGEVLVQFVRDHGCGVLLVEHDVGFVMSLCDTVSVLHLGQRIATGTPEEIQSHAGVREAYLG